MHWTAHPFPVAPGGIAGTHAFRPLRTAPSGSVRQPDLGGAPRIFGLSGFGAGMAAAIRSHGQDADMSAGLILVYTGTTNPSATGILQLSFPTGTVSNTSHVLLADWATFSIVAAGAILQCTWTANRTLLPQEVLRVAYQWSISQ